MCSQMRWQYRTSLWEWWPSASFALLFFLLLPLSSIYKKSSASCGLNLGCVCSFVSFYLYTRRTGYCLLAFFFFFYFVDWRLMDHGASPTGDYFYSVCEAQTQTQTQECSFSLVSISRKSHKGKKELHATKHLQSEHKITLLSIALLNYQRGPHNTNY